MTVHRGQGSQFRRVTVLLPPAESPLLTRELLYTAVTRAAADFMLQHLLPPPGASREEQVTGMLDRYVGWVETYR